MNAATGCSHISCRDENECVFARTQNMFLELAEMNQRIDVINREIDEMNRVTRNIITDTTDMIQHSNRVLEQVRQEMAENERFEKDRHMIYEIKKILVDQYGCNRYDTLGGNIADLVERDVIPGLEREMLKRWERIEPREENWAPLTVRDVKRIIKCELPRAHRVPHLRGMDVREHVDTRLNEVMWTDRIGKWIALECIDALLSKIPRTEATPGH